MSGQITGTTELNIHNHVLGGEQTAENGVMQVLSW